MIIHIIIKHFISNVTHRHVPIARITYLCTNFTEHNMGNDFFRFKFFTINQDKCAMKVGTDGVLLGAWTETGNALKIADIGTGTGLIAIMLAQKSKASIIGIEIDSDSAMQAKENMSSTLWKDRLTVVQDDIKNYYLNHKSEFDLIVSNPPFFKENTKGYSERRNIARHTEGLGFDTLTRAASFMLKENGRFCVIIPATSATEFISEAIKHKLNLTIRTDIITKPGAPAKRVIMEFSKNTFGFNTTKSSILILSENGMKSQDYLNLTSDFYL